MGFRRWDYQPQYNELATSADMTVFVPNSARALAMASNMADLSQTDRDLVGEYHLVRGNVFYSVDLISGTSLNSSLGLPLLITVGLDGEIYVNTAKVLVSDYLMYSGVFHTIDGQVFFALRDAGDITYLVKVF